MPSSPARCFAHLRREKEVGLQASVLDDEFHYPVEGAVVQDRALPAREEVGDYTLE